MLDKSGIYPRFIWDIFGMYPGFIYIPDKSRIYPEYIPEYISNISGIYSQIYLGVQGWGVDIKVFFNDIFMYDHLWLILHCANSVGTVTPEDQGPRICYKISF
jgi:hypothetical protein